MFAAGPGLVAKTHVVFCPGLGACAAASGIEREAAKATMIPKLIKTAQKFFLFISFHLLMVFPKANSSVFRPWSMSSTEDSATEK